MTDPIKIPFLNQKTDATGNPVPVTHADLPPAAGIANTMTVHEHVRIVQYMEDKYHSLLKTHQELIAKHEALKTAHEEKIEPMAHEEVKEEIKKDPIPQVQLDSRVKVWEEASKKAAEQQKAEVVKPVADIKAPIPASQPVFAPKVPDASKPVS